MLLERHHHPETHSGCLSFFFTKNTLTGMVLYSSMLGCVQTWFTDEHLPDKLRN